MGLFMSLSQINGVVLDMDGVLWRGDQALPGLPDFFTFLRAVQIPFALATNNSFATPESYIAKLAYMNVPDISPDVVITSSTATADYLQQHYSPETTIHVVGGKGLREAITAAGYAQVDNGAQLVVAGIDPYLTYDKLKRAALLIRAGAGFIGTNPDKTYPTPEGLVPGAGSILAALEAATDVKPVVIGKPETPMLQTALRVLGTRVENTLMIGDRLETDILGGQRAGMKTALVLTGVSTEVEIISSGIMPDFVFADLPALVAAWQIRPNSQG